VGELPNPIGQPIAVAYDADGKVLVQTREPATLSLASGAVIVLSNDSREDTGHTIFHSNAGASIACASCHAEGAEDGRTWDFACEGARRTQSLSSGISGTEPFHWNGDMKTFPVLMENVFVGRMSGPELAPEQVTAALYWIDHQPLVPVAAPADPAAVARGRLLFNDKSVGCASCHNGDKFTNNMTADVGTDGTFQVPSLLNVAARAPYMHDGCAPTLTDRFGPCGGGDHHGLTSPLGAAQIADLVAYLQTL
jgi:cytochrome c